MSFENLSEGKRQVKQHRIQRPGRGGPRNMKSMWPHFGGHLFYDLFVQGWGAWPPRHPLDPLLSNQVLNKNTVAMPLSVPLPLNRFRSWNNLSNERHV